MAEQIFEYKFLMDYSPNIAYNHMRQAFSSKLEREISQLTEDGWIIDNFVQSGVGASLVVTVVMRRDIDNGDLL